MARGRHASKSGQSAFLRDAAIMAVGIVIVAALMYGILWLIQSWRSPDPLPGASETTQVAETSTTTTIRSSTTTTAAPTTTTTSTTTTSTTVPVIEVRPPEEVTVLVLNSVGTAGLAGRVTARLDELGYETLEPDNYEPRLEQSLIWYKEGFGPEAQDLAANFPDAVTEFNPDGLPEADIVVLLGESYEEE
jgi:hypothetical protein